jgi:cytoskeletal protein CcmA (bactofilin family)
MLGKKENGDAGRSGELNTIIGKGSEVEGSIKIRSGLRVDGKIKGSVSATDSIIVGKDGAIEGEVHAKNAIIGGYVNGKLVASGKVVLEADSRFEGELHTAKLVIDEGAVFEGQCSMAGEEKPPSKVKTVIGAGRGGDKKPAEAVAVTGTEETERT